MESPFYGATALLLWVLVAAVAITGLTLPTAALRRPALAGVLVLALAFASLAVAGGPEPQGAGLPRSYLAITAALLLLGVGLPVGLLLGVVASPGWSGKARSLGLGAAGVALLLGLAVVIPMATAGGLGSMLAAVAAFASVGVVAGLIARRLHPGRAVRRLDDWLNRLPARDSARHPWDDRTRWLLAVNALCAFLALTASSAVLLLGAALAGALAGLVFERRLGRLRGWSPPLLLVLVVLAIATYLLLHVAGEMPHTLRALLEAPYSNAFQLLVSLLASVAAWVFLRLWPFHAAPRGPFTGVLGAALLFRLVSPVLADGALHWQPVFYPLAALAAWHAAATRRDAEAVTALGALGLLSGSTTAGWCGVGLVVGGTVVALLELLREAGRSPNARGDALLRLLAFVGALLVMPVLDGALRAQIVYTVVALFGLVAALGVRQHR